MPLPAAQQDILDSFIGPDGIYLAVITTYTGFDLGTKILYLERAISQDCHTFLESLDRIYMPGLAFPENRTANLEFIRALKAINDLCFNNEVQYGEHGIRPALTHFFHNTGPINAALFRTSIQEIINARILKEGIGHPAIALNPQIAIDTIATQKQARITAEASIIRQTNWRTFQDLPLGQLAAPLGSGLTDAQYRLLSPEVRVEIAYNPDVFAVLLKSDRTPAQIQSLTILEIRDVALQFQSMLQVITILRRGGHYMATSSLSSTAGGLIAKNVTTGFILLGTNVSRETANSIAQNLQVGTTLCLAQGFASEAIAIAIAMNLQEDRVLEVMDFNINTNIGIVIAKNLHEGAVLHVGLLFDLDPSNLKKKYIAIAKNMSKGSVLKLGHDIPPDIAVDMAKNLKDEVYLVIDHRTSIPNAAAIAEACDGELCLDPGTQEPLAIQIAKNLSTKAVLRINCKTQNIGEVVAANLGDGLLELDSKIPEERAIAIAKSLRVGDGLRRGGALHIDMDIRSKVAKAIVENIRPGAICFLGFRVIQSEELVTHLKAGAILQLDNTITGPDVRKIVKKLKPGTILMFDSEVVNEVITDIKPGVILYIVEETKEPEKIAASLTAGGILKLDAQIDDATSIKIVSQLKPGTVLMLDTDSIAKAVKITKALPLGVELKFSHLPEEATQLFAARLLPEAGKPVSQASSSSSSSSTTSTKRPRDEAEQSPEPGVLASVSSLSVFKGGKKAKAAPQVPKEKEHEQEKDARKSCRHQGK